MRTSSGSVCSHDWTVLSVLGGQADLSLLESKYSLSEPGEGALLRQETPTVLSTEFYPSQMKAGGGTYFYLQFGN